MPEFLIRVVVHKKHWRSGLRSGLFQVVTEVIADNEAPDYARAMLEEHMKWFGKNLHTPLRDEDIRWQPDWKSMSRAELD